MCDIIFMQEEPPNNSPKPKRKRFDFMENWYGQYRIS